VSELQPGHYLTCKNGAIKISRYWQVYHTLDFDHTENYFSDEIARRFEDSIKIHCRSDVPIGAYVSGGLDSSVVASMACNQSAAPFMGFTGKFSGDEKFDESRYARDLAQWRSFELHEVDITPEDFCNHI